MSLDVDALRTPCAAAALKTFCQKNLITLLTNSFATDKNPQMLAISKWYS